MANNVALDKVFQTVASALNSNKEKLNQADTYNQDHGDHMVEIFEVITQAMQEKKGAEPADQLAYASDLLRQRSQSGSAKMYAQNLQQAASRFKGQQITSDNGLQLIESLLGTQTDTQQQAGGGLGSLLGGLLGGANQDQSGLGADDLLSAGMAFLSSKQQGDSNMEAILDAVVKTSSAGQSEHRAQSGSIVANTLLQALLNK
ncbi:MAG: hypothetical protein JXA25_12280 [Anaerolineales bacterium]|nr:hypothetical protein [Anaerolineales bacterium]